jgi:hypothetical protein
MIDMHECPAGPSDSLAQDVPGARQRRRRDGLSLIPRIARCTGF